MGAGFPRPFTPPKLGWRDYHEAPSFPWVVQWPGRGWSCTPLRAGPLPTSTLPPRLSHWCEACQLRNSHPLKVETRVLTHTWWGVTCSPFTATTDRAARRSARCPGPSPALPPAAPRAAGRNRTRRRSARQPPAGSGGTSRRERRPSEPPDLLADSPVVALDVRRPDALQGRLSEPDDDLQVAGAVPGPLHGLDDLGAVDAVRPVESVHGRKVLHPPVDES